MCQVLGVKRNSYYAWSSRGKSLRAREDELLLTRIKNIFEDGDRTYGSPRIQKELEKQEIYHGQKRIARLMKENQIKAKTVKKFRICSKPIENEEASPNLVNRVFKVDKPNKVWVTDITYIWARSGWLYLCVFLDLYSRKVVGWSVSRNMKAELVMDAYRKAMNFARPDKGLIIHSDRGSQYGSTVYRNALRENEFLQSMSRRGDCWDNACMESFFHSLKIELIYHITIDGIESLKWSLFNYIDVFYNRKRLHSFLNYSSPVDFEKIKVA